MIFSLSPLTVEALFHFYFVLMFFALFAKLWLHYKKGGSLLAKHLAISFLFGGIEYATITISIVFFAYDIIVLKLLDGFVTMILYSIAVCYSALLISDLYSKIKSKYIIIIFTILGVAMLTINYLSYKPSGINSYGIVDLGLPTATMILISIQMMLTFVPVCITFVYQSFKKKLFLEGLGLGLGLLMVILFLPLTYQAPNFSVYIFFSTLVALGFSAIAGSVIIHPLLRTNRPAAPATPASPSRTD